MGEERGAEATEPEGERGGENGGSGHDHGAYGERERMVAIRRCADEWAIDTAATVLQPLADQSGGALLLLPGRDAACVAGNTVRAVERCGGSHGLVEARLSRHMTVSRAIGPAQLLSGAAAAARKGSGGAYNGSAYNGGGGGGLWGEQSLSAFPLDHSMLLELSTVEAGQGLGLGFELRRDLSVSEGEVAYGYFQLAFSFVDRNQTGEAEIGGEG